MATDLPTSPRPQTTVVRWISNSIQWRSPLSGATQIASRLGGYWQVEVGLPPMTQYDAAQWTGVLFGIDGTAGAVNIGPDQPREPDDYNPNAVFSAHDAPTLWFSFASQDYHARYISALTLTADGGEAAQATSINIQGLDGIGLNKGTYLTVDNGTYLELHIVTADAWPDANGDADVSIHPPLRKAVADDAAINIDYPRGEFLVDSGDKGPAITRRPGSVSQFDQITFREFVR